LLDRALLSLDEKTELDLNTAQKIFGYFDKSQLINLFELILKGEEEKVINIYRKIFDQGIEPKVFINDFLEILYYFKNINSLSLESTNFTLNDEEFSKIKENIYYTQITKPKTRFCVIDNREAAFFLTNDEETHPSYETCVWVNTPHFSGAISDAFGF